MAGMQSYTIEAIMLDLESRIDPKAIEGMARYGIRPTRTFGVSVTILRTMAKDIKRNHRSAQGRDHGRAQDHELALELWNTGVRDAMILATLLADPAQMTPDLIEDWVMDFDSWDVCDGCCNALLWRTTDSHELALAWSLRKEEFVKRAGYTLMATLAVHWKDAEDSDFDPFLEAIVRGSDDERNFVKKAVNWGLRGIGKRNIRLNARAIEVAEAILRTDTKSGKWIARDALRELRSVKVVDRLQAKEEKMHGHKRTKSPSSKE